MIALVRLSLLVSLPLAPLAALSNYDDNQWIRSNPGPHELTMLIERYGEPMRMWMVEVEEVTANGGTIRAFTTTEDTAAAGRAEFRPPHRVRGYRPYTVIARKLDDAWYISLRQLITYMP